MYMTRIRDADRRKAVRGQVRRHKHHLGPGVGGCRLARECSESRSLLERQLAGVDRVLEKPVDACQLRRVINDLLPLAAKRPQQR